MIKKLACILLAAGCCISLLPSMVIADSASVLPEAPAAVKTDAASCADGSHLDYAFEGVFINFHANGGTGSMERITADLNEEIRLTKNTFKRSKYKFIGWNTQPDGSGDFYEDGSYITTREDLDLYAQWKKDDRIRIKAPSKTVSKRKRKLTIKVSVKKGGKAFKNGVVKLRVAGKTYSRKTNSKGTAKFSIPVKRNKKLKRGKHKYRVTCKNAKIYRTIIVKR